MHGPRSVLRIIGSLWFAAVLLVLLLVAMACATVFESARGPEQALGIFYRSWWFDTLLSLLAASVLAALLLRFPFTKKQIGFVLTHLSILVTLGGALVTKYRGVEGSVGIAEGESVSEFTVGAEILTIERRADRAKTELDLTERIAGTFEPMDFPTPPSRTLGGLRAEVRRYVPDSEWQPSITNDNPRPQPAVEVALSASGLDEPAWLFPRNPEDFGGIRVTLRPVRDTAELLRLIDPAASSQAASVGNVVITRAGERFEVAVEAGMKDPVPLGQTGYSARVLRYLPHATVGTDNRVVNASNNPVNPFVEVELTGPGGTETHKAFARFPDFGSMHESGQAAGFKVTFVDLPTTPAEVLAGPDGALYVRFRHRSGHVTSHPLERGTPIDTPWAGRRLAVLRYYERARHEWVLEPVEPPREKRKPAVLLKLHPVESDAAESAPPPDFWVQKYQRRPATVGGAAYDIAYMEKTVPLPVTITLDEFHLRYYPGGRRPRSFESHVTVTDPKTHVTQSHVISMNNPGEFGGYTFYQSSYRINRDQSVTFLSVSRDWGQPIVFAGYFGLMAGMVVVLGTRMKESRRRTA